MEYHPEEVLSEQVLDQDHGESMFKWEQVNDHIEQDDHNIVEEDGTNTLIHDSFNVRMDDANDNENSDDFENENDIPLLDK